MSTAIEIVPGQRAHASQLLPLYQQVAAVPGGIIREPHEINQEYIDQFLNASLAHGLMLVAQQGEQVLGEIHAYTPGIAAFRHILTDLTIVVDPAAHGQGIGSGLFSAFLQTVEEEFHHILRVELYVREHNQRNVQFYARLGFINEGRQAQKIYMAPGKQETPLHMAWFNPQFDATL